MDAHDDRLGSPGDDRGKPDSYMESIARWRRGDRQALAGWWRRSWRYWGPRERGFLFKLLITLFLLSAVTTAALNMAPAALSGGIVHEAERLVFHSAERAFAALHDQIRNVVDHQIWRQAMTEKLLILALIAGVMLHAMLSYREIKEGIERSIDRMRERHKELKNEKKYRVLAKVAGVTGAILVAVPVYTIIFGGVAA